MASGSAEQIAAAASIDGTDGTAWQLPLRPDLLEPAPLGTEEPDADRVEAALALIHHHENIVSSSAVATGTDHGAADVAFRAVAHALLRPHSDGVPDEVDVVATDGGASEVAGAGALRYTRDRICCPRDMGVGAARQLRAHLNFVADTIDPESLMAAVPIPTRDRRDTDPTRFGTQSMAQM